MKKLRPIIAILVLAAIAVGIFFLVRPAGEPAPEPAPEVIPAPTPTSAPTSTPTSTPTAVAEPAASEAAGAALDEASEPVPFEQCLDGVCEYLAELPESGALVRMLDESADYNWSAPSDECLVDLETFLTNQEILVDAYEFRLLDTLSDYQGPVSYQLPATEDPINDPAPNEGSALCAWSEDADRENIACDVAVTRIEEGLTPAVRASLLLAAMDGVRRAWYENRQLNLQPFYHEDFMQQFEPVVSVPEPDQYDMACWVLYARPS